nr:PREDICTED: frizzled-6-like [Lepisosteus oculatus]
MTQPTGCKCKLSNGRICNRELYGKVYVFNSMLLICSPISESRRVLQESCEFFLKHNNRVQHKKKQYKPSSHKLKVISKSMGTSTGAKPNHGTSTVALANHDALAQSTLSETPGRAQAVTKAGGRELTPRSDWVESQQASSSVRGPTPLLVHTVAEETQEKDRGRSGT